VAESALRVGLRAKNSVAGGIVAVAPGKFGSGVFSPPLGAKDNSVRGVQLCRDLSERFGLHAFEAGYGDPFARGPVPPAPRLA
jgi:glutaminase